MVVGLIGLANMMEAEHGPASEDDLKLLEKSRDRVSKIIDRQREKLASKT